MIKERDTRSPGQQLEEDSPWFRAEPNCDLIRRLAKDDTWREQTRPMQVARVDRDRRSKQLIVRLGSMRSDVLSDTCFRVDRTQGPRCSRGRARALFVAAGLLASSSAVRAVATQGWYIWITLSDASDITMHQVEQRLRDILTLTPARNNDHR